LVVDQQWDQHFARGAGVNAFVNVFNEVCIAYRLFASLEVELGAELVSMLRQTGSHDVDNEFILEFELLDENRKCVRVLTPQVQLDYQFIDVVFFWLYWDN